MWIYFDITELPVLVGEKDRRIWAKDKVGNFSVANAVQMIRKKYEKVSWTKQVWQPCIHPYTSTNLRKILRGACATEETVRKKVFSTVSKCYLCGKDQDTMDHILWHCNFSKAVWHWLCGVFYCPVPINFEEILSFAKQKNPAVKEVWYICAFNVMVELWLTRNSVLHEDATPSVDKIKRRIAGIAKEGKFRMKGRRWGTMYDLHILLFFEISGIPVHVTSSKQVFFKYPAQHQILICCDGASKWNPGLDGIGFIARNHDGDYMGAASGGLGIATNYLEEVMALIVAGEWAITKQ
ncbi:uncharacterized protein LOC113294758 [Papaver somniferum]|uniref:uncharacterized protein LOC113294758 n=1 Tax=Papaver somniferum TaxID=3469 RepID=UPI000E6FA1E8|nr:uncharacterized protein LOC113294758 [Papaver somniferum]